MFVEYGNSVWVITGEAPVHHLALIEAMAFERAIYEEHKIFEMHQCNNAFDTKGILIISKN